ADVVERHIGDDVQALLSAHGAVPADVTTWIAHAGGPRILEAAENALSLPEAAFARSRSSLARVGNLSSASVLHILADVLADGDPAPGTLAVLFAFGPGVSAEVVLLRRPVTGD
ncbi:MAG TPA: 3-oxoacyl-[acyl-carrier-protein] synthase III C-terminal domain-containing protein, partial [Cellulomonas sp.]